MKWLYLVLAAVVVLVLLQVNRLRKDLGANPSRSWSVAFRMWWMTLLGRPTVAAP